MTLLAASLCQPKPDASVTIMHSAIYLILLVLLTGCATPVVQPPVRVTEEPAVHQLNRSIDALLLEASRTIPPRSTTLQLQAAAIALDEQDHELVTRIIRTIESPYLSNDNILSYTLIRAALALHQNDAGLAIRLLDNRRFQNLVLSRDNQVRASLLRARAYKIGRSYLASARELIYIDQFIPVADQLANHEEILATLLLLPVETLEHQAELSVTSEIKGWLSLAAMTKRYQHAPLQQLSALQDWQRVWSGHPAALVVPTSLSMLSQIVQDRPKNIALVLPLQGELGNLGRAIRDGYIAAHYTLTPDTQLNIYDSTTADVIDLIAQAHQLGAEVIIGPLDRDRVTRVAQHNLPVPVIALNRTWQGEINPNLYQFGLAPEDEARQVAQQVVSEAKLNGLVIAPDNDWGKRNVNVFAEHFTAKGGEIIDRALFTEQSDYSDMVKSLLNVDTSEARAAELQRITGERYEFAARRRQDIDFVFLLANTTEARGINPRLAFFYAEDIPVYATSHAHSAEGSRIDAIDMNGVRFCDIPWKLTSDDALQLATIETWPEAGQQLAPFFALGVDAHRLYPRLDQLKEDDRERIFGSTGILSLNDRNIVQRSLMWAQFKDGEISSVPMLFDAVK